MQQEQITVIEEKLAFQEHALELLNERVVSQQHQIDRLVEEVERLARQLLALAHASGIDVAASEAPPHY